MSKKVQYITFQRNYINYITEVSFPEIIAILLGSTMVIASYICNRNRNDKKRNNS